ncbi:uncharacterized protein LOC125658939 [Ostrea edulis]|uniref:uncharacterized protein LOC125658939 n=1 Tax=Ostrea edulis TaxID=37623 RepID=UPI0024AEE5ED|nr:uncharacterized protein LOC125658939 [Ostrea edulis]
MWRVLIICFIGILVEEVEGGGRRVRLGAAVPDTTTPQRFTLNRVCADNGALVDRGDNVISLESLYCLPPPGEIRRCFIVDYGTFDRAVCPDKAYINGFLKEGGRKQLRCCSLIGVSYNDDECIEYFRTWTNFRSPLTNGYYLTGDTPVSDGMGGISGFVKRGCLFRRIIPPNHRRTHKQPY